LRRNPKKEPNKLRGEPTRGSGENLAGLRNTPGLILIKGDSRGLHKRGRHVMVRVEGDARFSQCDFHTQGRGTRI